MELLDIGQLILFSYRYPVSNFSYRLLDQMFTDPLFNVMDLNVSLYRRARELQKVRLLRVALFYLKDFIFSCRCTDRYGLLEMQCETGNSYGSVFNFG